MRTGAVEELAVLHLQGQGQVALVREQCGHGGLWLPLQGLSHERINGEEHLAEPGTALLFHPGDQMQGLTSEGTCGVSILLPPSSLPVRAARQLIDAAWQLVDCASQAHQGARFAAAALVDALQQWEEAPAAMDGGAGLSPDRRRRTVADACLWMAEHLTERFSVVELSRATHVSVRTLQYSFQQELGSTPMAQAKRLRLRRLLQDPDLAAHTVTELMEQAGLLACGVTSADYRQWCGESPRRTRQRAFAGPVLESSSFTT